jgi:hypothetical protein
LFTTNGSVGVPIYRTLLPEDKGASSATAFRTLP